MSNQWYGKFGNSRVSFMNQKLKLHHFELGEKTKIKNFLKREVQSLLYVSVIDSPQKFFPKQMKARRLVKSDIPIQSSYRSQLGLDRLLNIYSSSFLGTSKHRVVIDCGTATCVDFATKDSYLGGWIAAGAKTGLSALHVYTDRLPLLSPQKMTKELGQTTEESMQIGVRNVLLGQMAQAETEAKKQFGRVKIDFILTGGWSFLVKNLTGWRHEPLLGLLGLKKIDEYRKIVR